MTDYDFRNRLIRAIKAVLNKYKERFKWQPKVIFLNGGRAIGLDIQAIGKNFEVNFKCSQDDDEQIKDLMRGIMQRGLEIEIRNE